MKHTEGCRRVAKDVFFATRRLTLLFLSQELMTSDTTSKWRIGLSAAGQCVSEVGQLCHENDTHPCRNPVKLQITSIHQRLPSWLIDLALLKCLTLPLRSSSDSS